MSSLAERWSGARPTRGAPRLAWRTTIFARLAVWFLLIALVPLSATGLLAYLAYRRTLEVAVEKALDGMAVARAHQVESYLKDRRREVGGIAASPAIADLLVGLAADERGDLSPGTRGALQNELRGLVELYVGRRGYRDLLLLSPTGRVLFDALRPAAAGRTLHEPPYAGSALERVFGHAIIGDAVEVSRVGRVTGEEAPAAFFAAPVAAAHRLVGVIALEIDWGGVAGILEPHTGLGRTGETYLADRDGDAIVRATALRPHRDAERGRAIALDAPAAQPILRALAGERGMGSAVDERDVPVVAAWRPLRSFGWGLVVRVDRREALEPAARLGRWLLLAGSLTALIASAAALFVARSFARPVVELTRITQRFAAGDLRARTSSRPKGEIGELALSFDAMADALQQNHQRLEETLAELRVKHDALRESESRFRQLADNIDVAFWIAELRPMRYLYMSPAFERMTGRQLGEILADPECWLQDLLPEDQPGIEAAWAEAARRGGGELSFRIRRASDGSLRWLHTRAFVLSEDSGGPQRIAGVTEDVTEQREAEASLRASEEMFRRLAETSRLVPWEADIPSDRFTYVGPQIAALGYSVEDWLGRGFWADHIHPDDRARVIATSKRLARERGHYDLEYRLVAASGDVVWVEDLVTVVRSGGKAIALRGFLIDITERKRAEAEREELLEQARAAQQRAEEASRLKDEFLATISHELRTPLNAMLGWSQVLESGELDEETAARAIATIARNARSQSVLIEDLLDVSRIITGRLRLDVRPIVDLPAIIEAAASSLRLAADAKEIAIRLALDPRAGPVLGDPGRLQQVVWNLLSNAIKFTPRRGEVHIALERTGDHARLQVTDTGEGIHPDFLPYVFDRFRQGDGGSTRVHGGLGLGLAIVRQLVDLHGGEVSVESPGPGKGATFTVRLPLMATDVATGEPRRTPLPAGAEASPADLAGLKVVAVDDEPDSLDLIRAVLERAHMHVETASTALDALQRVAESHADLLIADVGMPEHDGYWLIQRVRELGQERGGDLPAVALTAYARPTDRSALLAAGFQRHLAKPILPEQLLRTLADLVRDRTADASCRARGTASDDSATRA